ncbi:aromatic-L-amino-acid decarboxylase-like isoform X1 [Eriocheir sinensis]|uniref:aromatic-L-amino-acid decarboxylase-like isoform X1 n=1 Tax=Eriocheir sinensis TaxID=95602 RepID=UPI0021C6C4C3|nr:aromatic-L-amino-acid decarboxylase-like isoform X1 [Eriocheir sinensis]XP_050699464.1 aromatic-L-amino-acid decarboxylase-like isoform X1 [Eriocheir sinensis]XP_050699465.1 aromatic-L-amino-acid decarboxylase-like isoform X1 [Eriocheir sinensis]XP_050699466.1 aromatic-L-amino-acid decarboxylase-like isoform X1 [Eriocheir sinensis]XP_050699467.1 aromatic-L-amino-acid decarboxylase-like isoform X1 [Eriocheir sinensis]XP_050699468.1 aromatic-L-amino-acid decarboxylase-like isoform X1 [Erioche
MDSSEFRQRGKEMVDYIANYLDTIEERRVTPAIEPGYLRRLVPLEAPQNPEQWDDIMKDVEDKIMPGVTHWQHPRFHAYFPAGNSYPSILGDMLSDGLGCIGFSWAASPACTELETIVLDWLGKMAGLPEQFLSFSENSKGGGVIQGSASECVFVSLLAARAHTIRQLKKQHPYVEEGVLLSKMMAYCSKEAHSCVEKAAMMAFVKLRILEPDENQSLRGATLQQVMQEDRAMGLVPFYVETTLGTTSCCSFDNLAEIGPVCEEFGAWLHVDGAYGGNSFICPELRGPMRGIEYASSFNFNPNKFMLTNFDCSLMWVRDRFRLTQALVVDPLYLQHSYSERSIDYRHWGIPLSRRFRALKLWFVIRSFGVDGLQKYIREHCRLARRFEAHVRKEPRFEVASPVHLGLVCFRLRESNHINQKLLSSINASGKLHMVPASLNDRYVIRFCVCRQTATDEDIDYAWEVISQFATDLQEKIPEITLENNNQLKEVKENKEEEEAEEVEKEVEEVFDLNERKKNKSLHYKRSFFVRMVSDPKIYNPKIVRSLPAANNPRRHTMSESSEDSNVSISSPTIDLDVLGALMQRTDLKEVLREAEKKDRLTLITKTTSDLSERILVSPPPKHKPEH